MPSTAALSMTQAANQADRHEAILQFLNRSIGDLFYPAENFEPDLSTWNGTPIVFGATHPDLKAFEEDPVAELGRVGGRVVGYIRNPRIVASGHPRLMGDMEFTDGGEMADMIEQGRLSLSTAFFCKVNNGRIMGNVRPNHVLVFVESGDNMPKDQGSIILNKVTNMAAVCTGPSCKCQFTRGGEMGDEVTNIGKVMSGKNAGRLRAVVDAITSLFNDLTSPSGTAPPVQEAEMPAEAKKEITSPKGATDIPEAQARGKKTDRVSGAGSPDGLIHEDSATAPAPVIQEFKPDAATPSKGEPNPGAPGQLGSYEVAGDHEAEKAYKDAPVKQAKTPQDEGNIPKPMDRTADAVRNGIPMETLKAMDPTDLIQMIMDLLGMVGEQNKDRPKVPGPMDHTPAADTGTKTLTATQPPKPSAGPTKAENEVVTPPAPGEQMAENWGPGCKDAKATQNKVPSEPVKSGEGAPTSPASGTVDPNAAILNQLVEREKALQAKEAEMVALKHKVEQIEQEQDNAKWTSITNQLPKGMVSTPEKEGALRKEWKENPDGFLARVLNMKIASNTALEGLTQGVAVANQTPVARGIGVRDPYTGEWKDSPAEG